MSELGRRGLEPAHLLEEVPLVHAMELHPRLLLSCVVPGRELGLQRPGTGSRSGCARRWRGLVKAMCMAFSWLLSLVCVAWDTVRYALLTLLEALNSLFGRSRSVTPKVEYVFVLMLENRAFDHMFGVSSITGVDIAGNPTSVVGSDQSRDTNVDPVNGNTVAVSSPAEFTLKNSDRDPGHEFTDTLVCARANRALFRHAQAVAGLVPARDGVRDLRQLVLVTSRPHLAEPILPARCLLRRARRESQQPRRRHGDHGFASDLQSSTFGPKFVFIEPKYGSHSLDIGGPGDFTCGNSMHPLDDVIHGRSCSKDTYEAIRNSPLWEKRALIVCFDEHGGFYEHVAPPAAVPPGDTITHSYVQFNFKFDQLGLRVAALGISPLVQRGVIDHTQHDHTSMLASVERLFGLSNLTNRDKTANDFVHLFSLETPRTDAPTELNPPAVNRTNPLSCEEDDEDALLIKRSELCIAQLTGLPRRREIRLRTGSELAIGTPGTPLRPTRLSHSVRWHCSLQRTRRCPALTY
jgi:hypothetical protein